MSPNPSKDRYVQPLLRFIFEDEPQNIDLFLTFDFWSRYRDAAKKEWQISDIVSFRASRPSADPVYEAANAWRDALINDQSLFTGEPLDYRAATAELVTHYIDSPDLSNASFFEKLESQLTPASSVAVQLTAELLYLYVLPMLPDSMRGDTKMKQLNTVLTWRADLQTVPDARIAALNSGIVNVGTAYLTYRWRGLEFLIRLTAALANQDMAARRQALSDWHSFRSISSSIDVPASKSIRQLVEHMLFPDHAMASSSTEDRNKMASAFSEIVDFDGDPNSLVAVLDANLHYGDRHELNLYAAPHRFLWKEVGESLRDWAGWATLVLEGTTEATVHLPIAPNDLNGLRSPLVELHTDAASAILTWLEEDEAAAAFLAKAETAEPARYIDQFCDNVRFRGDTAEFVEAATVLLNALDPSVPVFFRTHVPTIVEKLGNIHLSSNATPGEAFQVLLEAMESLSAGLLDREGLDLTIASLANLAQETLGLNPSDTDWSLELQQAFRDWRDGRKRISPDDVESLPEDHTPQRVAPNQTAQPSVPQTIDALAHSLNFVSPGSKTWLELTRDLLTEKRQLILQGPPGTGKTFVARKLANFLAQDPSRVTLVQFHPATSYEDFVQGLRPSREQSGRFDLLDGPLLKAADQARQEPSETHVIIIDEINRANLPAVFGELYFLLEYRNEEVTLNYGDTFRLPPNLLFIGTMNTADRSVASIDAALRRRFVIRDLRPGELPMDGVLDQWLSTRAPELTWLSTLLTHANELIGDPDQHIGPSHFLLPDDKLTDENAMRAWEFTVMPTLREFFYGQPEVVEKLQFDTLRARAMGAVDDVETE
ncbi:McrB family protein [Gulosibacter chungangensis]|uniref:AAA domain-containing protein n=1 Tax=Gulosibacter chungangensis TaxID=979746 RepID=A0A7J5BC77_9MICO|nr:AAA family ATPase [Gulosibacter chungangensis]KAB1642541.1 AAA domain-containing protein [Gulosibacter chungangensis]